MYSFTVTLSADGGVEVEPNHKADYLVRILGDRVDLIGPFANSDERRAFYDVDRLHYAQYHPVYGFPSLTPDGVAQYRPEQAAQRREWALVGTLKAGDVVEVWGMLVFPDGARMVVEEDLEGRPFLTEASGRRWYFVGQIDRGVYLGVKKITSGGQTQH